MDSVVLVAIIGATATVVASGFAAWTGFRQHRVDQRSLETRAVHEQMRTLVEVYRSDNNDWRQRYEQDTDELRARVCTLERRTADLTAQVTKCESDKAEMKLMVTEQVQEIDRLRRALNGN